MGNRVSGMLVRLATTVDDPVERLAPIREATRHAKEQERAISAEQPDGLDRVRRPGGRGAGGSAGVEPAGLRPAATTPLFNVVISNVPGPPVPLYLAGARVMGVWPMGPIIDGAGLNITVMSYLGSVNFGLVACREVAPDLGGPGPAHRRGDRTSCGSAPTRPDRSRGSARRLVLTLPCCTRTWLSW